MHMGQKYAHQAEHVSMWSGSVHDGCVLAHSQHWSAAVWCNKIIGGVKVHHGS